MWSNNLRLIDYIDWLKEACLERRRSHFDFQGNSETDPILRYHFIQCHLRQIGKEDVDTPGTTACGQREKPKNKPRRLSVQSLYFCAIVELINQNLFYTTKYSQTCVEQSPFRIGQVTVEYSLHRILVKCNKKTLAIYIPFDEQEPVVGDEYFLRWQHDGVKDSNAVACKMRR